MCEDASELGVELQNIAADSVSISEAEIVSEAAKLESERKLAEQVKMKTSMDKLEENEEKLAINEEKIKVCETEDAIDPNSLQNVEVQQASNCDSSKVSETIVTLSKDVFKASENMPKVSILEECLTEPSEIETPIADMTKSAVTFLQEPEEQTIDSPLVLSPKVVEDVVNDMSKQTDDSSLFVSDEDMCQDASESGIELKDIATDSVSISEAAIISEAAKLESDNELAEQVQMEISMDKFEENEDKVAVNEELVKVCETEDTFDSSSLQNMEVQQASNCKSGKLSETTIVTLSENVFKASENIPKVSILEERLKEPPKIETPTADVTKSPVKFLQESEEQTIDSPLVLSPKMEETVNDISKQTDDSPLFVSDEDICEDASELGVELQDIATDSALLSEAEIISEAAKLENEEKLAEQVAMETSMDKCEENKDKLAINEEKISVSESEDIFDPSSLQNMEVQQVSNCESDKVSETIVTLSENVFKASENIPKVSILEECLKEPTEIETPIADMTKSAVTFLQEPEEQTIDSPLVLSPKVVEDVVNDISKETDDSSLLASDEDIYEDASDLVVELEDIATDSVSISEAEIISEAAKLESEKKLAEQEEMETLMDKIEENENKLAINEEKIKLCETENTFDPNPLQNMEVQQASNSESGKVSETDVTLPENIFKASENIPKVSILEEHLKEPSEIEIATADVMKLAVKCLQEPEEQTIGSPLVLSPKMEETINDISKQTDDSSLFASDEDMCEDASELVVELEDIATDSISISEAEIISEAVKLESERKLAEEVKMETSMDKLEENEDKLVINEEKISVCETEDTFDPSSLQNMEIQQASNFESGKVSETIVTLSENVFKSSENMPKVSILEERLKEPPEVEIATADMMKSTVKCLHESEEQTIDSPLVLSPKMDETINDISKQTDDSSLFVSDEDICEDASELVVELEDIATDSISISEAEIISEAVKLESERKLAEQVKMETSMDKFEENEDKLTINEEKISVCETEDTFDPSSLQNMEVQQTSNYESGKVSETIVTLSENVYKASENMPKVSILEERLKEPSEIETPTTDVTKSAVKFLQESEEQTVDSPLVLSPKMVETVNDMSKQIDDSSLFVPDEDMCEDASELVVELEDIAADSISISEAEIISEAVKLESERKLAEEVKMKISMDKCEENEDKLAIHEEKIKVCETEDRFDSNSLQNIEVQQASNFKSGKVSETDVTLTKDVFKASENIPKVSILEERLKVPPKIEIPTADMTKVSISPTTSKDSLLIQKDAKLIAYQKMLESPKLSEKSEPKIMETPRKDSDKHDFENVGSPRIILKIAKSAITDCGEPRSPKSPKIRSATNSPNPEDSPGQKLGKIKLKLSKGGHPSIISNENIEEAGQWYSEGSSSLSPIGMKIKLSKSGDASIVSSEKHEFIDDSKEVKHKFEEVKRTESPIGMKIKLSKSGDASIVQQDSKDMQMKHKDKLDMVQGSPKRTESPIGMKIKLSKSGDASIVQPERQDLSEDHRDNAQLRSKEKLEAYDSPKRTDSPIGMKIKLSKSGDVSIVSPDMSEDSKEINKIKDKVDSSPEIPKRTESPVGMKIKLAKTKGGASIIPMENPEDAKEKLEIPDMPKRTESPFGMKIKLSKSGDASIVHSEISEDVKDIKQKEKLESKEKSEGGQDVMKSSDNTSGMKIKVIKSGETSVIAQELTEKLENIQESSQKVESSFGMKIKLSKFGDASIVPTEKQEQPDEIKSLQEIPKRTESPLGMKIKLSKTGDASIIQTEVSEDTNKMARTIDAESKAIDATLGMKIKLLKTGDASIVESEKKERHQRRRDTESPLEMKIKLSKTGHPTIVACENHGEFTYKSKEDSDQPHSFSQRYKDSLQTVHKEPALKILKTGHSTILQSNRSELTIEPVQMQNKKVDNVIEISPKRKEITIAPIEAKKSKLEAQLTQILPEVTIQPVTSRDQKQFLFDPKNSAISLQQMNVISQEISITQVRPTKPQDAMMNEKLKDILTKNTTGSPINSDCEIIEHRPELIIVNENSNSSQDVMIIEEVSPNRMPEVKVPKKRGRPRRNPIPQATILPSPHLLMSREPLSMEEIQQMQQPQAPHFEARENERPKRTCRSQKSYAPPKRGRGRGRGKRKLDSLDLQMIKKPRIDQDLSAIEASTTAIITIDESSTQQQESFGKSPELYKVLKQPVIDSKISPTHKMEKKTMAQKNDGPKIIAQRNDGSKTASVSNSALLDSTSAQSDAAKATDVGLELSKMMPKPLSYDSKDNAKDKKSAEVIPEKVQKIASKSISDEKADKTVEAAKSESRETLVPPGHSNWLTPISKRPAEGTVKQENVSMVQVIDEETRMSAESNSRSQTPARNISAPASETIVNEESQGSVLSTATTESEKVKVKNRRMEINFDPDEGPFTVDKIAEYEWPLDRKGETFMIQEQISQYLGVKSFKRKYPDLKRRVVDMEERNYLRENGLVSEAMCDMGLTAICSSEVLDVMCSDFPDQYEEYRKHMREKQVKEHSKKQKELTAAANAEKNRIDLAEMAVQSALAWNISLNKARKENRKCSLDLQTFTIHVPKKQQKVEAERKIGHYPVALIPGQYTDYYREYTPAELRYYPLNTVLYGPMRPNEHKFDSQSEGSQSDSDSDSSSDDSSSSSSEGTQDTEGSQSTMDDVDMEIVNQKDEVKLKCKMCLKTLNKHSKNEVLIQCGTCNGHVHPSCIDLTLDMVPHIQSYAWQCTDCKTCAQCHDPADEDKMLFCDMCDRGYHIYCVGLRRVPQGRWHCQECAVCANCSSREPGGMNSDRNSVAQWQHEYKKGDKNTRVYVSTLCVPCSKLWRKGRYCPHCSRCHTAPRLDLEANLVHCSACDKYLHLGCVETKGVIFDRKNYLCDFCAPNRHQVVKPLISKTLKI